MDVQPRGPCATMYVCICNAIRERDLKAAVADGAGTAHEVMAALGCVPVCGCCLDEAEDMVAETRTAGRMREAIGA